MLHSSAKSFGYRYQDGSAQVDEIDAVNTGRTRGWYKDLTEGLTPFSTLPSTSPIKLNIIVDKSRRKGKKSKTLGTYVKEMVSPREEGPNDCIEVPGPDFATSRVETCKKDQIHGKKERRKEGKKGRGVGGWREGGKERGREKKKKGRKKRMWIHFSFCT